MSQQQRVDKLNNHLQFKAPVLFHPAKTACSPGYDYVIVGAGSSGCALAARLAEKFPLKSILLVDAGGDNQQFRVLSPFIQCPDLQNSDLDFAYRTTPQPLQQNRQSFWPRAKMLGGCSSMNFMLAVRGDSRGYDKWANQLGCPGWDYASLEPYFRKLERYTGKQGGALRGRQGPITITDNRDLGHYTTKPLVDAFVKGCAETGVPEADDYNLADRLEQGGAAPFQTTINQGKRSDAASGYLFGPSGAFATRPNLHCLTHHQAAKVLFDETGKVAVAVEFIGGLAIRAHVEVVLCAGAVGTPQILMLSGVGPRAHLESKGIAVVRDLPGVGRNLKDHVMVSQVHKLKDSCVSRFSPDKVVNVVPELVQWGLFNTGLLSMSWVQSTAFFNASSPLQAKTDANALQIHVIPFVGSDEELTKRIMGFDRQTHAMHSQNSMPTYSMTFLPSLLQPKSMGWIELSSSRPEDHPIIEPNYLSHPDDLAVLLEGWKYAMRVGQSKAMSDVIEGVFVDDSVAVNGLTADCDEYALHKIKRDLVTIYHPCCTCKMGPDSDPLAVLDPRSLKVKSFANLRVVDCSAFPDIPAANTNLPAIMIGERAADLMFREAL